MALYMNFKLNATKMHVLLLGLLVCPHSCCWCLLPVYLWLKSCHQMLWFTCSDFSQENEAVRSKCALMC